METEVNIYLTSFCQKVQKIDHKIRFVGIAEYGGKLVASYYREGLVPLMDRKDTEQYALQTVFRARTRGGYKPQLGEQKYATAVYDRLIRATITIAHTEYEYRSLYLLLSLDTGSYFPSIIEDKVLPLIAKSKQELFQMSKALTEHYAK